MGDIERVPDEVWKQGKGPEHRFRHPPHAHAQEPTPLGDFGAFAREVLDDPGYAEAADEASAVVELLSELERRGRVVVSEDDMIRILDLARSLRQHGEELAAKWPQLRGKLARLQGYARKVSVARRGEVSGEEGVRAVGGE